MLSLAAACDEIKEHAWCGEICEKLHECVDDELGVDDCADRCTDEVDKGDVPESDLEDCAECVDDHICREVTRECGICEDLLPEFTSRRFD
jgi:hypothetical protein